MPTAEINYAAVLVAGSLSMVIGMIWYSLSVFGRPWMKEVGLKEKDLKKGPGVGYLLAVGGSLVQAYILAHFVDYTGAVTWVDGAVTGLWAWAGFVATAFAVNYVFAQRSANLWAIDSGYYLALLLAQGALLAVWA
jgi:hypothetical protein